MAQLTLSIQVSTLNQHVRLLTTHVSTPWNVRYNIHIFYLNNSLLHKIQTCLHSVCLHSDYPMGISHWVISGR